MGIPVRDEVSVAQETRASEAVKSAAVRILAYFIAFKISGLTTLSRVSAVIGPTTL
jgi:hypothetical protein